MVAGSRLSQDGCPHFARDYNSWRLGSRIEGLGFSASLLQVYMHLTQDTAYADLHGLGDKVRSSQRGYFGILCSSKECVGIVEGLGFWFTRR